jgi:hypothetical protein
MQKAELQLLKSILVRFSFGLMVITNESLELGV